MAYKTLYRVFRPRTFDDVVGQAHITDILKKQVDAQTPSHAYLFCGPRGTGKTSTAKILANALNCLAPKDGNPCGECDVCQGFLQDSFVDIVEIDAASNNGVDNVRDIRDKVSLLPAMGKFKVYIIDEVHMLSPGAFNALLKTLEEPPPHAVFILATTELRKVPATILSRCQKYDFRRISDADIIARMEYVAGETGVTYEADALSLIAQQAEGALRDALSIMDQCVASSDSLTVDTVTEVMGIAPTESLNRLADSILSEDPKNAITQLHTMLHEGVSAHNLLRDLISALSEKLAQNVADTYERSNILRSLEALIAVQADLRYSSVPNAVLLAAVVRATVNTVDVDTQDLELRIKKLELRVERLMQGGASAPVQTLEPQRVAPTPQQKKEAPKAHVPAQQPAPQPLAPGDNLPWEYPAEATAQTEQNSDEVPQLASTPPAREPVKPAVAPADTQDTQGKLEELKAAVMQQNAVLFPSICTVQSISIQGTRLTLHALREDAPLIEMLADEGNRADMAAVTQEVFGQEMTIALSYGEEKQDSSNIQMELISIFGEENVKIIE